LSASPGPKSYAKSFTQNGAFTQDHTFTQDHAAIEGRVAFALAAFALAIGLVALVDMVGAPARVVELLGPVVTLAGLATIGLMMQTMRMSRFYAGQRAMPPRYAGLAAAALASALLLPFLPPNGNLQSASQAAPMAIVVGLGAGFALAVCGSGPLLRKTGAFSIADLVAGRFPHSSARLLAAFVCATAAALVTLAGLDGAADGLVQIVGLSREAALIAACFVVLAIAAPGGAGGLAWSAAAAGGALIAGLSGPFLAALGGESSVPLPWLNDDLWSAAASRVSGWHGQSLSAIPASDLPIALAAALGVASLAPLLLPSITTSGAAMARRAGLGALIWLAIIVVGAMAAMAISTLALDELLVGRRPQSLASTAYQASSHGLLTLCGQMVSGPAAALEACRAAGFSGALAPNDIRANGLYLLSAAPELRGLSVALSGLLAAGLVAISLTLAASGVQAFATAIAHDMLFRAPASSALTSRRLAATRMCAILLVIVLSIASARHSLDARALIAFAIAISGATLAPLLAMTMWPRSNAADATRALAAGLIVFVALALVGLWGGHHAFALAIASLAGFGSAMLAGLAFSFRRTIEETREGRAFLAGVLHGEAELLNRDRGA
jgi:cation/acetate symporter